MEHYSKVQARGFLETEEGYNIWFPWLHQANIRNLRHPQQTFYVGHYRGQPAGVMLRLYSNGVEGIYAVATVPDSRHRGVSTTLLARAVRDARLNPHHIVALQVVQGSYAEKFYTKLGFSPSFVSPIFAR